MNSEISEEYNGKYVVAPIFRGDRTGGNLQLGDAGSPGGPFDTKEEALEWIDSNSIDGETFFVMKVEVIAQIDVKVLSKKNVNLS